MCNHISFLSLKKSSQMVELQIFFFFWKVKNWIPYNLWENCVYVCANETFMLFLYFIFEYILGNATAGKASSDDSKSDKSEKSKNTQNKPDSMLILSGGEGYIDFRIGNLQYICFILYSLVLIFRNVWKAFSKLNSDFIVIALCLRFCINSVISHGKLYLLGALNIRV